MAPWKAVYSLIPIRRGAGIVGRLEKFPKSI